jgi:hypothetical protein
MSSVPVEDTLLHQGVNKNFTSSKRVFMHIMKIQLSGEEKTTEDFMCA